MKNKGTWKQRSFNEKLLTKTQKARNKENKEWGTRQQRDNKELTKS